MPPSVEATPAAGASGSGASGSSAVRMSCALPVVARRLRQALLAQYLGQAAEDGDVLVPLGGDGHHQMHHVIAVPADAAGHLQHGDAGPGDQLPVPALAVGDGDAIAQEGIRLPLSPQHAVGVGGLDGATVHQQLGRLANG
jgi:hypothetical protein